MERTTAAKYSMNCTCYTGSFIHFKLSLEIDIQRRIQIGQLRTADRGTNDTCDIFRGKLTIEVDLIALTSINVVVEKHFSTGLEVLLS